MPIIVALLLFSRDAGLKAAEAAAPEHAIKAAYLYNFALYAAWPQPPADGIVICVTGRDGLGGALDAIAGKPLRGKPVSVRRLDQGLDFNGCHVLYVGAVAPGQRARIAQALGRQPILSVAESVDGEDFRPMILLAPDTNRIAFEIELSLARAAGLDLSSQLLRLARAVR